MTAVQSLQADLPFEDLIRHDLPARFNEANIFQQQWPRIHGFMSGAFLPPFEVLIHPSSACNLACVWCIGDHVPIVREDGTLSASKENPLRLPDRLADPVAMMKLVESLLRYEVPYTWTLANGEKGETTFRIDNVSFSGLIGEPLVAKKALLPAMEKLVEHHRRVGIFTNGILMNSSTWPTFSKIAYIHLSLDAANSATYSTLKYAGRPHGEQLFSQALKNLEGFVRYKGSNSESQTAVNASFIMYPENYSEVFEAAKILKALGVGYFRIKQDISGKRLLTSAQRKAAAELLDRIDAELVDEKFKLVRIHRIGEGQNSARSFSACHITKIMGAIGSDGQLYPCNYHPRPGGAAYGNAVDEGFQAVWEGEMRQELAAKLPSICPAVCDPFKNRSNHLFDALIAESGGNLIELGNRIQDLVAGPA